MFLNFKFLFKCFLNLLFILSLFIINIILFGDILYFESESVLEKDGWTKDPNSDPNNKISDFPWGSIFLYFFINLSIYYTMTYFGAPSYSDTGVQTEPLEEISRHLTNLSDSVSILGTLDSPTNPLPGFLSETPAVAGTGENILGMIRSPDLTNALKAQEICKELLKNADPEHPNYRVYKIFVGHAKRIFFNALTEGLEVGTPEFTEYMDKALREQTALVSYLAHNGVALEDLLV